MRKFVLTLLLIVFVSPAFAARQVNLSQLEQVLTGLRSKPDTQAAYTLGDLELTERMNATRLSELEKSLPGEKSRQALWAIADESQFLPPGAAQIADRPAPDFAEQKRIIGLFVEYVRSAIPQLPNFLASRVTTRFEDTPQIQSPTREGSTPYEPMHFVSTGSEVVGYQGGREEVQSGSLGSGTAGLVTRGVFGPILGIVLVDAARSKLAWSHWEQGPGGVLAVFQYEVLKEKSNYAVDYCCLAEPSGKSEIQGLPMSSGSNPGPGRIQVAVGGTTNWRAFHELAAYHGEMALDPATGLIRKLSLIADMKKSEPVEKAAILVEYGPIEIGGRMYNCPVHSVSLSLAQTVQTDPQSEQQPLRNQVTDTVFQNYHVFRAESRVLTAAEARNESTTQPALPKAPVPPGAEVASTPAAVASTNAAAPPAAPTAQPPATPSASASAEPEINIAAASDVPNLPAPQTPLPYTGFTLRTTSRLVEVPVVAFDKKGRPLADLKPDELEVYDNGRKQHVGFFGGASTQSATGAKAAQTSATAVETVSSNRNAATPSNAGATTGAHATVLLIDSNNVAFSDLTNARREILRFLKTVPADERVGLYVLHRYRFQILLEPTADHAQVEAKLTAWMPNAQDLMQAQNEEDRNRQNMDTVQHATDLLYVNGNTPTGESDATMPVDPQLRSLGDSPARDALAALLGVGRHLGAIPGYKSLVWVASDNVLADFSDKAPDIERGDKILDPLQRLAGETLNDAHVSLYPLDASQLEAGGVGANLESANVQVKPTSNPGGDMLALPKNEQDETREALEKSQRDVNPGRLSAQLQQDTHPIQGVFRDLATMTGGRALPRAQDLATEMSSIVADGRAAYLLSFTPDTAADGKYHVLTVKCLRPDVTLRYRNGYYYAQEPKTVRERFREAVWQPRDENEIGLTAAAVKESKGAAVRLSIAATDLQLAEQNGRWTDTVDVFLVVRDDSNMHAVVAGKRLGLALEPATYQQDMKDGLVVEESLPKISDGSLVRIIVIDENSRRMGSVTVGTKG